MQELGFVAMQSDRFDVFSNGFRRCLGIVRHPWKSSKECGRGPIDRDVCALGGQDCGKQQFVGLLPVEFTVGVGMRFGQRVIDPPGPGPGRRGGGGQRKWEIGTSFGHPEVDILGGMHQAFSPAFVIEESAVGGNLSRLDSAHQAGFRSVAIDATVAGRRPRELDVGARSDLRRRVTQQGMSTMAVTLPIPPEHFVREETADRACAAAVQAIGFAESLNAQWLTLPTMGVEAALVIQQEAERRGRHVLTIGGTNGSGLVEVVGSDVPAHAGAFRLVAASALAVQLPFAVFAGLHEEHGFPIFVSGDDGLGVAERLARDFASLLPECVG